MEQRIGPSIQPLQGAAADPAFVPGITGPRPEEPEETASAEAEETAVTEEAVEEEPREAAPEPEESTEDGPVFEAADRRARIVADGRGVRLSLDEEACEFRWDEIGAVETATARFGKRFTVTVHTPDRRWYPIEIEAPARASFKEWESQLDAVLDAYFEEDEKAQEGERAQQDAKAEEGEKA
ncbi:hypothetical protein SUDANB105_02736 [Streptomyces sp. enrichment culture]|uniref:hypothetical protein n=1 Tax=Streptomyces sp. enrichment culture TaxID=1795815 RepID=UPI003F579FB0